MYDSLNPKLNQSNAKKDLTNAKTSCIMEVRCFACNRLLFTGHIEEGLIQIKCGKCGRLITIGANNSLTSPTREKTGLKLIR